MADYNSIYSYKCAEGHIPIANDLCDAHLDIAQVNINFEDYKVESLAIEIVFGGRLLVGICETTDSHIIFKTGADMETLMLFTPDTKFEEPTAEELLLLNRIE